MTWDTVEVTSIVVPDWGWKEDDPSAMLRLAASVAEFGQLMPLVVRSVGGRTELVDGRRLLAALVSAGLQTAVVASLGSVSDHEARRIAVALETRFPICYASLAGELKRMADAGADMGAVSAVGPFGATRIAGMVALLDFDWSRFSEDEGQHAMDWDGEPATEDDVRAPQAIAMPGDANPASEAEADAGTLW